MFADNRLSWTPPRLSTLKLTDLGRVDVDLGLCCIPLGPGIGDGSVDSLFELCWTSGGAGELTQLAVIGFTTDKSSNDDLGLGVSARVKVLLEIGMGVKVECEGLIELMPRLETSPLLWLEL